MVGIYHKNVNNLPSKVSLNIVGLYIPTNEPQIPLLVPLNSSTELFAITSRLNFLARGGPAWTYRGGGGARASFQCMG